MAHELTLSKLDAARRQLETALQLYFSNGDAVSIHTLTNAAYSILRDISSANNSEPMLLENIVTELTRPEKLKEALKMFSKARDFFKHANQDPMATLKFDPGLSEFYMFDACLHYEKLTKKTVPIFRVFTAWFLTHHSNLFNFQADTHILLGDLSHEYSVLDRSDFLARFLPLFGADHA